MKKSIALFICLLIVFSMTACGNKSTSITSEDSKNKIETATDSSDSNTSAGDANQSSSVSNSGGSEVSSNSVPTTSTEGTITEPSSNTGSAPTSTANSTKTPGSNTGTTPSKTPAPPASTPPPQPPKPTTVTVTIPEGYTISQIGDKLAAAGVCSKADFLKAVNTYNFSSYSLVAQIPSNPHRDFKLEGYLYPNTYQFYLNKPAQDAVGVLIRGAQAKITGKYSYPGMTLDQIITLASIIEKESPNVAEMTNISSVLHNRLNQKMRLQADSTIYYIERYVKPIITGDINRYNSYYNTYKFAGLPAGPIGNPGTAALNAAIHPAQTKYLYFVCDKKGKVYYAETYDEQIANCALAGVTPGQANQPSVQ